MAAEKSFPAASIVPPTQVGQVLGCLQARGPGLRIAIRLGFKFRVAGKPEPGKRAPCASMVMPSGRGPVAVTVTVTVSGGAGRSQHAAEPAHPEMASGPLSGTGTGASRRWRHRTSSISS